MFSINPYFQVFKFTDYNKIIIPFFSTFNSNRTISISSELIPDNVNVSKLQISWAT